ncbi:PAP2 superfamily protein [Nocardia amikacinitolerans]|uniref:PAP2 superfamily protein n=1 Tax=Nocardia amikacinitolerans TaxID=756689 RepID=A0A285LRP6_9NOCA|nr:phosphatase PAP2 family protein [Nocardia amikacinitolerans]SNY87123.1 PAP2 superfamily protein [Nocardia amikacinitolerans]
MVAVGFPGPGLELGVSVAGTFERVRAAVHGRGGEAIRQLALITVLYLGYRFGRLITADDTARAYGNAHDLLGVESRLGMLAETTVQAPFLRWDLLAVSANFYYATAHFTVAVGVLLWLWVFRPRHYRLTRNLMVGLTGAGLLLHVLLPLAPPRMLPERGFVDLAALHGQSVYGPSHADGMSNQFAAMPSLHVGWALLLAVAVVAATRTRWRWLALAHPALTTVIVIGTGNHYWLDAIIAVLLLAGTAVLHRMILPAAAAWEPLTQTRSKARDTSPIPS